MKSAVGPALWFAGVVVMMAGRLLGRSETWMYLGCEITQAIIGNASTNGYSEVQGYLAAN
jgi:hypothetical protein